MGVTTSGIRWPEPVDPINQGAVAMRNIAEDVTTKYGRGILARTLQTAAVDITTAGATLMSTVLTLSASRWIRVYASLQGQQITAATATFNPTIYANNTLQARIGVGGIALSDAAIVNGDAYFLAGAGTLTVDLRVTGITAGAFRVTTGGATFISVVDVGGPTSF
jgi:hypothetical protein